MPALLTAGTCNRAFLGRVYSTIAPSRAAVPGARHGRPTQAWCAVPPPVTGRGKTAPQGRYQTSWFARSRDLKRAPVPASCQQSCMLHTRQKPESTGVANTGNRSPSRQSLLASSVRREYRSRKHRQPEPIPPKSACFFCPSRVPESQTPATGNPGRPQAGRINSAQPSFREACRRPGHQMYWGGGRIRRQAGACAGTGPRFAWWSIHTPPDHYLPVPAPSPEPHCTFPSCAILSR